jgi:hypothetical protein
MACRTKLMCYMKNGRFADGGEEGRASISHQCQGSEHHHSNVKTKRSLPPRLLVPIASCICAQHCVGKWAPCNVQMLGRGCIPLTANSSIPDTALHFDHHHPYYDRIHIIGIRTTFVRTYKTMLKDGRNVFRPTIPVFSPKYGALPVTPTSVYSRGRKMVRTALYKQVTRGVYNHETKLGTPLAWHLRPQLSLVSCSSAI